MSDRTYMGGCPCVVRLYSPLLCAVCCPAVTFVEVAGALVVRQNPQDCGGRPGCACDVQGFGVQGVSMSGSPVRGIQVEPPEFTSCRVRVVVTAGADAGEPDDLTVQFRDQAGHGLAGQLAEDFRPGLGPSLDGECVQVLLGQQPPVSVPPSGGVNPRNDWRVLRLSTTNKESHVGEYCSLGGWCSTGSTGWGVTVWVGREWFNGWPRFLNPVGVKWVWGLS